MEIEGSDGSKTKLKPNSTTLFGRSNGFHKNDLAVSRRHISFELHPSLHNQTAPKVVSFEVLGKNPVWVYTKEEDEDGKLRVFERFQRGELGVADMFCVSAKDPVWFTLKNLEEAVNEKESEKGEIGRRINDELSQSLESANSGFEGRGDFELGSFDVADIDPVKEFGFLVIGHEFDQYPKQMIRDIKNWDWFLDDPRGESDDDEVAEKKGKRGQRRKRKKGREDDDVDEEWTGESEDDEVVTTKVRKVQKPEYRTRSKDPGKPHKDIRDRKSSAKTRNKEEDEEYEDEDEEDETLGGFIVDSETVEEEDDEEEDLDEEEEFVEDEDELED